MTDEELTTIEQNLVVDQSDDSDVLARQASSGASALIAALVQAEADRDRARDAAVAMEQQLAEIKKLAYMGGQNGEVIRTAILGVFEGDLHEEDL